MTQAVHDMTGKVCQCGHEFTISSYSGSIIEPEFIDGKKFLRQRRVCRKCHNEHFSKGE